MAERTFGWVQDPGKLKSLRLVVEVFDNKSETHNKLKTRIIPRLISEENGLSHFISELNKKKLSLKYRDLVGTHSTPRSKTKCNAVIQATVRGQTKPFISDWAADNFVRWAQALGFIKWDKKADSFSMTPLGLALSRSERESDKEYRVFERAFLSYPPVSRIIKLLFEAGEKDEALTKFEIGRQLGFIGEEGFTSISQNLFVKEISLAPKEEKSDIRSNWEGDSDKYARMICSWLSQLKYPWVTGIYKQVKIEFVNQNYSHKLQAYTLTRRGIEIRKYIDGSSKFSKVPKLVNFEMLSTKGKDRQYLRTRRALILNFISKKTKMLESIQGYLKEKGLEESTSTIQDDIKGLENIGLSIDSSRKGYCCSDEIIGLKMPRLAVAETRRSDVQEMIEQCRSELKAIPHDYLVLISLSFESQQNRMFEIKTMELLIEQCKFSGLHLGGGNKPDGLIYNSDYGVIIDTKAYEAGFNIPAPERDKMKRYIDENVTRNASHNRTEWWNNFPANLKEFLFLFVSGKFGGDFKTQLKILSERTDDTLGGAMPSVELLKIADGIAGNRMNQDDFRNKMACLDEVTAQ
ncbi:MAG: restriction endonuclease FokI C-terminal domain-containing protein [Leadbetterella sp.]|nr:restriction endonuclease FokI C-terminal domain-containing protein [Leadbetterella sp.]